MAELEKLGSKFRVAQKIAKDPRFERLPCSHKGTYADDCLVNRVTQVCSSNNRSSSISSSSSSSILPFVMKF